MKRFKKLNTIFYRLVLSYLVLLIIITVIVGGFSYAYFSKSFEREMERANQRLLNHISQTLDDNIFRKVEEIYLDIAADQFRNRELLFFASYPIIGNHGKVLTVHSDLRGLIHANTPIVDSIDIYYSDNNIMISSKKGIKYLDQDYSHSRFLEQIYEPYMLGGIQEYPSKGMWYTKEDGRDGLENITFTKPYPFTAADNNYRGYISIHVNKDVIIDKISKALEDGYGSIFIVDDQQCIIGRDNDVYALMLQKEDRCMANIVNSEEFYGNFIESIDDEKYMISYFALNATDWKLVNIVPISQYYRQTVIIRRVLLVICIISLVVGVLISRIFTFNLYSPVKGIIENTNAITGNSFLYSTSDRHVDEYAFINDVINNLSIKVNDLENTIDANESLIKHNFILSLANGSIKNEGQADDIQELIGLQIIGTAYRCIMLELDRLILEGISIENKQFIKYNVIWQIERHSSAEYSYIGTEISDCKIIIVMSYSETRVDMIFKFMNNIIEHIRSNYMIDATISIGREVDNLTLLEQSFQDCETLLRYKFYIPDKEIFVAENWIELSKKSTKVSQKDFEELERYLKKREIDNIAEMLSEFVGSAGHGNYSIEYCDQFVELFVYTVKKYIDDINEYLEPAIDADLHKLYKEAKDIRDFQMQIFKFISHTFDHIRNIEGSYRDIIERAKDIVEANLSEDLSLDYVAERVYISSSYLSKTFRIVEGIGFSEFVTQKRLQKASSLILETDLTIEQVGYAVGYNSPAYFNKKFKECYGITPGTYRRKSGRKE